ncbi:MAG: peptidylprolyl isomerase [Novosphingobium sp.]|nr:peptidylprolyl isomerase [Novosphingobium sp.]
MIRPLLPLVAALAVTAIAVAQTRTPSSAPALAPGEIVAAAPASDWVKIAPSDLLVIDLAPDAKSRPRRVVIQLMPPPFSQGWIGNIRKLAAAHWWDGLSVNRVQDNYVVQWGDADAEDKAKARALPTDLRVMDERAYQREPNHDNFGTVLKVKGPRDIYADWASHRNGWAVAGNKKGWAWPVHCYGMVGVGRDLPPSTGSGAELYTVIGHAPRHLDRNIALVGRVIEGIEHLSSLPRGTGALGFYETAEERTPITSVRLGNEVSALPAYEYLSTESPTFARYADARANRRDPFFIKPAGGADICNIPVPVRRVK